MSNNVPLVSVRVIEVDELKDKIPTTGTRDDEELQRACEIASMHIETLCVGTKFIRRTFTEDYSGGNTGRMGGAKRIWLNALPIVSVTSITDDDGNTVAAADYTIEAQQGYLEQDSYWSAPVGRWTIVYEAGIWERTDQVEWDVKEWARIVALRNKNFKGDSIQSGTLSGRAGSRSVTRAGIGGFIGSGITLFEHSMIAKYRRRGV